MMRRKLLTLLAVVALCATAAGPVIAKNPPAGGGNGQGMGAQKPMTNAQRKAAAVTVAKAKHAILADAKAHGKKLTAAQLAALAVPGTATTMSAPLAPVNAVETGNPTNALLATPDYFGNVPNYANSQLPTSVSIQGDGLGAFATATIDSTGAVTGFNVIAGGDNYTLADVVVIGGGGTGAVGAPTIVNGSITAIAVATDPVSGLALGGVGYGTVAGIRKFVDALPLPGGTPNHNGQYLPVAVPDTTTFAGTTGNAPAADYYEIAVVQYTQKLHDDLPATTLRGYVQIETSVVQGAHFPLTYPDGSAILDGAGHPVFAVAAPQYLGPIIVAQANRPTRIKFDNYLPTGVGGSLFIPVDSTVMGSGMGPNGMATPPAGSGMDYSQNRATLHLHGGVTPWISDGTADQWTTPTGTTEQYPKGVSTGYVPDQWYDQQGNDIASCDGQTTCTDPNGSTNPGTGRMTFYYTNQQSARLMFYHDHAFGITRLNVYAGEAAGYLLQDQAEAALVAAGTLPGTVATDQIPLVVQDKTFVPDATQLAAEDPTWNTTMYGGAGNVWYPHVYMTNQNPAAGASGVNAMGRWDYGHWFWPVFQTATPEVPNPLCDYTVPTAPVCPLLENPTNPGIPNPSIVPEGFMDTMLVNGTPYPYTQVGPHTYRLRILNASNDRTLNLSLFIAGSEDATGNFVPCTTATPATYAAGVTNPCSEVAMVPAVRGTPATKSYVYPDMLDGRVGGVPDVRSAGPSMVQIGTEGGFLSKPVTLKNAPVGYNYNRRDVVVLNVTQRSLTLGPAERADVLVDFSGIPAGQKVILYNDSPAPMPAFDTRYDFFTGDEDQVMNGGAPTTLPGYGPNTRTVMQFQVGSGIAGTGINRPALDAGIENAYATTQAAPVVPEQGYDAAFGISPASPADPYGRIQTQDLKFKTGTVTGITLTDGGTGYVSPPTVLISGGGGSGATAIATLAGTGIVAIVMGSGGTGYTSQPTVSFSGGGGGSGATAIAAYSSTVVTGTVPTTTAGSGYTTAPTVTLTGGGGSLAAATAVLAPAGVASVTMGAGGAYTSVPTVGFSAPTTGTAPTATAVLGAGPVALGPATMVSGGSGYTAAPTVTFTPTSGASSATGTAALNPTSVGSVLLGNPGSLYTSAPTVAFNPAGATATTRLALIGSVGAITLTNGGTGYTRVPSVSLSSGGGSGATAAVTAMAPVGVGSVQMVNGGTCTSRTSVPTVTFNSGNGGSGAQGTASIGGNSGNLRVTGVTVTNPGSGYALPPTIAFSGGSCTNVSANAYLRPTSVATIMITARGQGYTSPPRINIQSGGGSNAAATSFLAFPVASITLTGNGGNVYTAAPSVSLSAPQITTGVTVGVNATATATLTPTSVASMTVTNGGSGYLQPPTVVFTPVGPGSGANFTVVLGPRPVASVTINLNGSGSGYTTAPTVSFSPVGGGATATSTLAASGVASINVTAAGAGYTSAPTVSFSTTGSAVAPTAVVTLVPASITALTLTAGGSGYSSVPIVVVTPAVGDATGAGASGTAQSGAGLVGSITLTNPGSGFIGNPTVTFAGGGGTGATATALYTAINVDLGVKPLGIQELFDEHGRMNATMSVEIPNTNGTNQTTIPYGYIDPPTEVVNTNAGADALVPTVVAGVSEPLAMLPDGTQIWRFTHNGVDTHSLHFHMFNLELINRVGWDGAIRPPDANEMGWKETIRMSPLEDVFVAIKPIVPNLPWPLPNSIRPLDVTSALEAGPPTVAHPQYTNVDPNGNPVNVFNHLINFGWEYVYHCHLLGHEENDMMRPMLIGVAPVSPSNVTATSTVTGTADVTFTDNSPNETGFTVQRSVNGGAWVDAGLPILRAAPVLNADFSVTDAGRTTATVETFHDTGLTVGAAVAYRVIANDLVGDTTTPGYAAYTQSVDSVPSVPSVPVTVTP